MLKENYYIGQKLGTLNTQQIKKVMLHPPKKRRWSDVTQILSGQGVDPTSLLRRSERGVMDMQCNFHKLQFIVFTNN